MSKQNALLFVADDMGYGDFGLFNDGPARMPHVDVLANGLYGRWVCDDRSYENHKKKRCGADRRLGGMKV